MSATQADVHVIGLLRSTASWAKFARELIRGLREVGVEVTAEDWPEAPFHDPAIVLDEAIESALATRPQLTTTLTFASPEDYSALGIERQRLWAFLVYEADRWPTAWLRAIDGLAGVVVPSQFCADGLVAGGVPRSRIVIVPPGVDTRVFHPGGRRPLGPGEPMRLLFVGTSARRKGLDLLLDGFGEAFQPGDDVVLTVKTTHYPDAAVRSYVDRGWQDRVEALQEQGHAVRVLTGGMGEAELADLFRAHDLLCQPTRGEGSISLSTLEAMACGTPALTVLVPGVHDLEGCPGLRLMIPDRRIPAIDVLPDFGGTDPRAVVSEVSVGAVAAELRWAYEHQPSLTAIGAAAAVESARWGWRDAARAASQGLGLGR